MSTETTRSDTDDKQSKKDDSKKNQNDSAKSKTPTASGDPGRTPGSAEGDEETIDEDIRQKEAEGKL
jgi:hypothetical protein